MNRKLRRLQPVVTEIMILPDGRVLSHNLTAAVARVLCRLDAGDWAMRRRANARDPFK